MKQILLCWKHFCLKPSKETINFEKLILLPLCSLNREFFVMIFFMSVGNQVMNFSLWLFQIFRWFLRKFEFLLSMSHNLIFGTTDPQKFINQILQECSNFWKIHVNDDLQIYPRLCLVWIKWKSTITSYITVKTLTNLATLNKLYEIF